MNSCQLIAFRERFIAFSLSATCSRIILDATNPYDAQYELQGVPGPQALEFVGPDGEAHGWVLLNTRKEPIIWATTQYQYVFGPLRRFGNLLVPDWATTSNGLVRYEMVSLTGSNVRPDLNLFAAPPNDDSE